VALALTAGACNLVLGIVPGELGTGGGGHGGTGGHGGHGGAPTGGTGGTGGSPDHPTGGHGGTGGGPTCTPNAASCEGAVLHVCDANGHPKPDVTCSAVAACDAAARTCIDAASRPRLSVGASRACAIEANGEVRCWGGNYGGQLVPGDTRLLLPTATPVPGAMGAQQVSVGSGQQCAVKDDGSVICWGSNDSGELGAPGADSGSLVTAALPAGAQAVEVSTGQRCSCARLSTGDVYCWGSEDTGCLGMGAGPYTPHPTPTAVPGVKDAVQIRAGSYYVPTCARRASGAVTCWNMTATPVDVPGVTDAIDVAVARHMVFILSKSQGILWTQESADGKGWLAPTAYPLAGTYKQIAAGEALTAVRDDGVVMWALLYDKSPPPVATPLAGAPPGMAVEVSAGYADQYGQGIECLRLAGSSLSSSVYCWGDDAYGALGADAPDLFRTPQVVPVTGSVAHLSADAWSTSALMADGSIQVWGTAYGLHGVPTTGPTTIGFLGNDNAGVETDDANHRAYVVKKSGALVLLAGAMPAPGARLLTTGATNFAYARGFGLWDIGRLTDGTVLIHAENDMANQDGIYGNGTTTTMAPENVTAYTGASAVAAYGDANGGDPAHVCAVHGTPAALACWGLNYHGEVGDGSMSTLVTTPSAVTFPNNEAVVSVATGPSFTCAAGAAGHVYCWGSNDRGQLGDPSVQSFPVPNPVPGISTAAGVTAGDSHVCAWLSGGSVLCWGANERGQIGDGTLVDRPQPFTVPGISDAVQVIAGVDHTCARLGSGGVKCWGTSYAGQVGTGVMGLFDTPLMVQGL
jgi:alpha-tubulin suppressor-like RCC1 family protein